MDFLPRIHAPVIPATSLKVVGLHVGADAVEGFVHTVGELEQGVFILGE